ncbi:MAG TPA: zinc-binding dehydrogenase [Geminicoccaceae bacterium]|jgi:threonine dehydrogenase-like Zn-dependent dehydrogenase|nr:zinc-binding dehydrogenase [Geminicoccaceae bacterium]HZA66539.1 zinc-binding dehydrogenase [Geminicoccaceae bacterium]
MRGVVFTGDRQLEIRSFPDPTPGPGEVVLQIKASGMCGSDLKFYRSPPGEAQRALGLGDLAEPNIAGHEPCGVVAAVGPGVSDAEARLGMRVMDHHYCGCGVCHHCRVGWSQLCGEGFVVYGVTAHGAHADYMKVPARTVVPLPDALSFATGAAISCGTGTAYNALRRMNLSGRDTLAVFGLGPVGLSAVQLAAAMGARVIALDITPERRDLVREFGADAVIDPAADEPVDALKALTHGQGVDLALDCSGAEAARAAAIRSTRTWGTVCLVGEGGSVTIDVSRDMIRKQLTVIGSWTFSSVIQAECARFVADRKIDVERLFTHRYTLDQAAEAYRLFDTQTTGKGVFLL